MQRTSVRSSRMISSALFRLPVRVFPGRYKDVWKDELQPSLCPVSRPLLFAFAVETTRLEDLSRSLIVIPDGAIVTFGLVLDSVAARVFREYAGTAVVMGKKVSS